MATFSQVGGIPTSAREPHWWHINGVPNNMTRKWLPQMKCLILFLGRASVPMTNDCIWSFNSQPLISCPWLPNRVTQLIKCWKLTFRQMAKQKSQPKEWQKGDGRRGQFPSPLANVVPCPEVAVRPPQCKTLPRNTSDLNR